MITGKKVSNLRATGRIPAVVYGAKTASVPIDLSIREFIKVYEKAGESDIVSLVVDGETKNVLIYDVDLDPLTSRPRHVDFYAVEKGQKIETEVPIVFVGEAPAVKELGANLIKVLHELKIEADATAIPHEIEVDVSLLTTLGAQIEVRDLKLPPGVILLSSPDEIVATVVEAKEEPVEAAPAPDMSTIEISEERGKKEVAEEATEVPKE